MMGFIPIYFISQSFSKISVYFYNYKSRYHNYDSVNFYLQLLIGHQYVPFISYNPFCETKKWQVHMKANIILYNHVQFALRLLGRPSKQQDN